MGVFRLVRSFLVPASSSRAFGVTLVMVAEDLDFSGSLVIDGRRIKAAATARIYEGVCW